MGRIVYATGTEHTRFHDSPDCPALHRGQVNKSRAKPIRAVDLDDVLAPDPCRVCWPEAPKKPKIWHQLCTICHQKKIHPCQHNGGVRVRSHPENFRVFWVWPENASHYTLVNS